jgi:hypothetical protein
LKIRILQFDTQKILAWNQIEEAIQDKSAPASDRENLHSAACAAKTAVIAFAR